MDIFFCIKDFRGYFDLSLIDPKRVVLLGIPKLQVPHSVVSQVPKGLYFPYVVGRSLVVLCHRSLKGCTFPML